MPSTTVIDANQIDFQKYVNEEYNSKISRDFYIQDFGNIIFAANEHHAKYARVPFVPDIDDKKTPVEERSSAKYFLDKPDDPHQTNRSFNDCTSSIPSQTQVAEYIVGLMRHGWKLPSPQLLISVTGGTGRYELPKRIQSAFQRGLMTAAVTTDAWIITEGSHEGVMKEVGNIVEKCRYNNIKIISKVKCIGIANWYFTTDHDHLSYRDASRKRSSQCDQFSKRTSLFRKLSDLARNVTSFDSPTNLLPIGTPIASEENRQNYKHSTTYETQNKVYRGRLTIDDVNNSPLDLNHTHFVLLDDMLGEVSEASNAEAPHRPDLAIKMRAEIEHQISKNYRISIVQILANGGPSSILTVCEALEQGTPIIVIADTNRAADLIIREYKYLYGDNSTDREARRSKEAYTKALPRCNDYYAQKRWKKLLDYQDVFKDNNCEKFAKQLTSYNGYMLISTFQLRNEYGENKLEDTILHALLNATKMTKESETQRIKELRLAIAWNKFDLAQKDILTTKTIGSWTDAELDEELKHSIRTDKVRFADLLIEYGASFDRLQESMDKDELYQDLLSADTLPFWESDYTDGIQSLNQQIKSNRMRFYSLYLNISPDDMKKCPVMELFLWSLFANHHRMATYLCSRSSNSIIAALLANRIYQKAAEKAPEREKRMEYVRIGREFAIHASTIIDMCFAKKEQCALDILIRKSPLHFNKSPLDLAEQLDKTVFLATKTVQRHLDQKWYGCLRDQKYHNSWISMLIF
ncbi:unnamed protein product, partial [Rotaria sordida]